MLAALHFQYSQSLPWVILLVLGLSLGTLLAYPAQVRQMPWAVRWLPPSLRILAMSTIALSVLRPVVTRARIASERAPIVVLLDNSRSMSVVDSGRSPGEWVGVAAALGRLPADARDKKITAIQADCDQLLMQADDVARVRAELEYARLSGRGVDAAQAQLDRSIALLQSIARDASAKASVIKQMSALLKPLASLLSSPSGIARDVWLDGIHDTAGEIARNAERARLESDTQLFKNDAKIRDACLPLQSLSRLQISEDAALDPDNGLIARLGNNASVKAFGLSDQVTPIAISNHLSSGQPLTAIGTSTNLTGGIRMILDSLKVSPPRALVLFSDGRQINAETDPATMTTAASVPIFTISLPPRSGFKDLSIISAVTNPNAIVGETITLKTELRAQGLAGASTDITFTGGATDESRRVKFADDRPVAVTFSSILKQPGVQRFSLDLAGVPGEASFENNHVERWVTVSSATTRPTIASKPAIVPTAEAEMVDLSGDVNWLSRIAESSGGQVFRLDQVDLLASRLAEIRDDVSHPIEVPLWDSPYLFVLVLGFLAAEWGLRKGHGMA